MGGIRHPAVHREVTQSIMVPVHHKFGTTFLHVRSITCIGAICFWAIDKFANDRRLAQRLRLLVVFICIAAILQRVLPLLGIYWL